MPHQQVPATLADTTSEPPQGAGAHWRECQVRHIAEVQLLPSAGDPGPQFHIGLQRRGPAGHPGPQQRLETRPRRPRPLPQGEDVQHSRHRHNRHSPAVRHPVPAQSGAPEPLALSPHLGRGHSPTVHQAGQHGYQSDLPRFEPLETGDREQPRPPLEVRVPDQAGLQAQHADFHSGVDQVRGEEREESAGQGRETGRQAASAMNTVIESVGGRRISDASRGARGPLKILFLVLVRS